MPRKTCSWMVLGLLLLSGCGTFGFDRSNGSLNGRPGTAGRDSQAELPPAEAAPLWLRMAKEMEDQGQVENAIVHYKKAREADPKLEDETGPRLAVLYDMKGDSPLSTREFDKALERQPKNAQLQADYGYHCYRRHDWAEAEKHLRRATELDKKLVRAWVNLGLTLAQEQRYQESLEAFRKVLAPAEAQANLGIVLAEQGKRDEARQAFQEALRLEPGFQRAQAALVGLSDKPVKENSKTTTEPQAQAPAAPSEHTKPAETGAHNGDQQPGTFPASLNP